MYNFKVLQRSENGLPKVTENAQSKHDSDNLKINVLVYSSKWFHYQDKEYIHKFRFNISGSNIPNFKKLHLNFFIFLFIFIMLQANSQGTKYIKSG